MRIKETLTASLLALAVSVAVAQGPGYGRGGGCGMGYGGGNGPRMGQGQGGWWNRATPTTAAQKAFVSQAAGLHNELRTARQNLRALQASGTPAELAAAQKTINGLQAKLTQLQTKNQPLMRQLGVNCNGVCDGTGPKGMGRGQGRRGANCPWRQPTPQP